MRACLLLLVGCAGSSSTAGWGPPGTPAPLEDGAQMPEDLPCEGRIEGWPHGYYDRYAFTTDGASPRHGFKTKAGAVVIAPRFAFAYPFSPDGVAAALDPTLAQPFVFIDPSGKVIAHAYAFDNGPDYFQDRMARIVDGTKIGFMDATGKIVVPPTYDRASSFCNGVAEVTRGAETFSIDKQGKRRP